MMDEPELKYEEVDLPPVNREPGLLDAPPDSDAGKLPAASREDRIDEGRSRKQMRTSEIRYRRLFEAARDGILILDPDTRKITDANPFILELLACAREELLGKELWQIGLLEDEKMSQAAFHTLQENYFVRYDDLPLQGKGGQTHDVEVVGNLYEEDGRWVVQCNIRDITQRKCADRTIAEQAALLDKAQDAILVQDLEGRVLFWNEGAERIYGLTRPEVMGKKVAELFYSKSAVFGEINHLTITKGEWSGELIHLTRDLREIVIEARWTLIRDSEGRPKSVLAINTDITEKKKIEAQFLRAQRMVSIGALAGGIAHDLNNILTPIMVSIDVLNEKADSPQIRRILQTIEVSARRGADIVRQVLSFARGPEEERIEVQPKHLLTDLKVFIQDSFPKNIELRFFVSNDTWTILGDPTQLHQILLNLCVNARDAMPRGGCLTISMENCTLDGTFRPLNVQATPGRYVKIGVTDSGVGMSTELLHKIFEPFFTTKDVDKGTGLGLSTVMGIVKTHDGAVDVQSEQGVGSSFKIYLPAVERSSTAKEKLSEEIKLPRGNGEMVLVVDDEASILAITGETLEAFGYRVLTASNGADAVTLYEQHREEIAVVLTDMMMPGMDGPATIRALLNINPAARIIASSGFNLESGLKYFLTKPYTAATLLGRISTVLNDSEPNGNKELRHDE